MLNISSIVTYWKNTGDMPFLLRLPCQGGMGAGPVLLLLLMFPFMDWNIDGRSLSYAELWSSGAGVVIGISLLLVSIGVWGLAARRPASRWALVAAPIAPVAIAFLPMFQLRYLEPVTTDIILNTVITAFVVYVCLFHIPAVKKYLAGSGNFK